ncbi:hypothetical protein R6Q59_015800 [Mikania micrantha]
MTTHSPPDLRSPLIPPTEKHHHEPPIHRLCIDTMLHRHCGEFGYWQFKHFVLTCTAWALEAFHTMVMIFADREPDWTCEPGSDCNPAAGVCELQPGTWRWEGGSGATTVAEWGLICSQKYKVGLVQAVFFGGCMIAW